MLAAASTKVARAENNCHDLSTMAKKVGSNYSLFNRRLFCVYKQGFAALAAGAGATSAILDSPENPNLWTVTNSTGSFKNGFSGMI
ncbi:hypothetical protein COY87_00875 [Candidatus Roizmanbacteria bacterium CG_4_10_14_0_8_um_filter_33_9]|uniref:Uncharacterized protein n=1 Tax=Candidatus Roizmanbacteria bacterium CG_4_10_14_0_8_um_filter_33_9 TaxID=1974826 RepID=A0A2M7QJE6_9BACT|nr:MAG: hypothetical protein COY87_00875 [Candidatus Roizmanbacteria bacterium CG_4_10_14_0_8_um_filter_33_9]